jgi:hypothetical protein
MHIIVGEKNSATQNPMPKEVKQPAFPTICLINS